MCISTHRAALALSLGVLGLLELGCAPDLGVCDGALARQPAFVALPKFGEPDAPDVRGLGGQPMFEGQALLATSCAGGQCHSSSANADERHGVPAGFNLDVDVACDRRAPASACPPEAVNNLRAARNTAYDHRFELYGSVSGGSMPPAGPDADAVRNSAPTFVRMDGTPLPEITTPEGQAILRNWLACRTPVVERTQDVGIHMAGEYCGDGAAGDCVYGPRKRIPIPDPQWDSIYELVVAPLCVSCHGPGTCPESERPCNTDFRIESQLDLSTADLAYTELVGIAAAGAYCKDRGLMLVAAGNPDGSFLLEKLGETPRCGDQMPQSGQGLPENVLTPIRQWIMAGAMR